jgi:hypothetical protein
VRHTGAVSKVLFMKQPRLIYGKNRYFVGISCFIPLALGKILLVSYIPDSFASNRLQSGKPFNIMYRKGASSWHNTSFKLK